ncbi:glycerophosphoryl diester phosphodiesterase [Galbibacter orientalis DSM 19592]|uniref:Glycerophosphoryl diester phosphodiesterase n=1 Tax=Galbibacter orientalis DSM 19592 TaxID=926559 RepID=I3C8Z5_9FLAO|nr:glycerophosphodiester phosphodiesterase family protein [Galbibacter orientalis]EIJ40088.1 glycerophosphoryl diester phosphodiesterase [Galbibacter orientalis DSM 19592]
MNQTHKIIVSLCCFLLFSINISSQNSRGYFQSYQDIIEMIDNPSDDHVMVVAHRGDWRNAPENSIKAVLNCIEMGVEIVEIDIRITKDNQLVVIHDLTLDRTTTGTGKVKDKTLEEIKELSLKNGANGITAHKVPTLKEMMLAVKDKSILLNLDKAWEYLPQTVSILKETGTLKQCIFKGNDPYEVMIKKHGNLLKQVNYMPMVWPADYNIYKAEDELIKDPVKYTNDYIEQLNPLAFEVIYSDEESSIFDAISKIKEHKISVWVNTLWGKLCAFHQDDVAVENPDKHYGWVIDHGANIIQTDRPQFLINYLKSKNLRNANSKSKIPLLIGNLEDSTNKEIMVVAHRGDWRNAPENSLQAIKSCIDMGVDMVEIDVRETKDGKLVLMHDEILDRTTNGQGLVSNWTLDSLKTLHLLDGLGVKTPNKIPTLEEALRLCKGKILVNLDKSYSIFDKCFEIAKKTETLNQIVIKGNKTKKEVEAEFGQFLDEVYFMPIVKLNNPNAEHIIEEYLESEVPIAFEFTVPQDTISLIKKFKDIRDKGAGVWVNSLWPQHNGGHDDEKALLNPEIYNWFIDANVDMIQTDRPALLLQYLRARGLHQ